MGCTRVTPVTFEYSSMLVDSCVTKSAETYASVKENKIDFFTFSSTVLNDRSNGTKIIYLTRKFAVIKFLKFGNWNKLFWEKVFSKFEISNFHSL